MKSLLITAFMLIACSASAQKIRFTDNSNYWISTMGQGADPCTYTYYEQFSGDTVINGKTYRKMIKTVQLSSFPCHGGTYPSAGFTAIREDTAAGFVYYYDPGDNADHVLYNYNLHAGDVIDYGFTADKVDSTSTVTIDGVPYKMWVLTTQGGAFRRYCVVEGMGTTNGPLYPLNDKGTCNAYRILLCSFLHNGTHPATTAPYFPVCPVFSYTEHFVNSGYCAPLDIGDIPTQQPSISIYPNPATDNITLSATATLDDNTTISVYDATGRRIYHAAAQPRNEQAINTTTWSSGLYMIIVSNNNGTLMKEKIAVMH